MKYPIDQWSTVGKRIDGSIAFTSKNLRGILRHPAKVVRLVYWKDENNDFNGRIRVIYADGVVSEALFASYRCMLDWMMARRIFKQAEWVMKG